MGVCAAQGPAQKRKPSKRVSAMHKGPLKLGETQAPTAITECEVHCSSRRQLHTPHNMWGGGGGHGCIPPLKRLTAAAINR